MKCETTVPGLAQAVMTLARQVQSLEKTAMVLGARMRQPNNTDFAPSDWYAELEKYVMKNGGENLTGAFGGIHVIDRHMSGIDRHLNAIRAHLDGILQDADERRIFRLYQKPPQRG